MLYLLIFILGCGTGLVFNTWGMRIMERMQEQLESNSKI